MDKDNIPIYALKRLAEDLQQSQSTQNSLLYDLNKQRITDFIERPYQMRQYQSYQSLSNPLQGNSKLETISDKEFHPLVPGVYSYPKTKEMMTILPMQNLTEFQKCLGTRSRFGDGDGSFFDSWIASYDTDNTKKRAKPLVDIGKSIPHGGPLLGIKSQYMFYKSDPEKYQRRTLIKSYNDKRNEKDNREQIHHEGSNETNIAETAMSFNHSRSHEIHETNQTSAMENAIVTVENDQKPPFSMLSNGDENRERRMAFFDQHRTIQRQYLNEDRHKDINSVVVSKDTASISDVSSSLFKSIDPHLLRPVDINEINKPSSPRSIFLEGCVANGINPNISLMPHNIQSIHSYDVISSNITDPLATVISKSLSTMTHLKYVNISKNKLSSRSLCKILQSLMNNTNLQSINISYSEFLPNDMDYLVDFIEHLGNLREFTCRGLNINDKMMIQIVEAVSYRSSIQLLNMGENSIGLSSGHRRKSETSLKSTNDENDDAIQSLSSYLRLASCSLKSIVLDWNHLRGNHINSFAEALTFNTSLTSIDISSNSIGSEGGELIGQAIQYNNTLEILNVSNNHLNDTACYVILCGYRLSESLTMIDISNNYIGDIGMNAVIRLLIDNIHHRKQINLSKTSFRIKNYLTCWFDSEPLEKSGLAAMRDLFDKSRQTLEEYNSRLPNEMKKSDDNDQTLSGTQTIDKKENIIGKYDLSNPYERCRLIEKLNIYSMHLDTKTVQPPSTFTLHIQDPRNSNDQIIQLHLVSVPRQSFNFSVDDIKTMNTTKNNTIGKNSDTLPVLSPKVVNVSRTASNKLLMSPTNSSRSTPRWRLPKSVTGSKNGSTQPSPRATIQSRTELIHNESLFYDTILANASALYKKYDTKRNDQLTNEKITLIVKHLLRSIEDSTLASILKLHESLECGPIKESEFLTVLSSIMIRFQRAWILKNVKQYYAIENSVEQFIPPTTGTAQLIVIRD